MAAVTKLPQKKRPQRGLCDVSWGATITLSLTLIANEVVSHLKSLQSKEEAK